MPHVNIVRLFQSETAQNTHNHANTYSCYFVKREQVK